MLPSNYQDWDLCRFFIRNYSANASERSKMVQIRHKIALTTNHGVARRPLLPAKQELNLNADLAINLRIVLSSYKIFLITNGFSGNRRSEFGEQSYNF